MFDLVRAETVPDVSVGCLWGENNEGVSTVQVLGGTFVLLDGSSVAAVWGLDSEHSTFIGHLCVEFGHWHSGLIKDHESLWEELEEGLVFVALANEDSCHVRSVDMVTDNFQSFSALCSLVANQLWSLPADLVAMRITIDINQIASLGKEFTIF